MRSLLIIPALVFVLLVLSGCSLFKGEGDTAIPGTGINKVQDSAVISDGEIAPGFTLEGFDGAKISLDSYRGKAVFLDFWAAWCPFCIEELPKIEAISQEFGDELVVLGIHRTETESIESGADFATDKGVTYTLLKDSDGSVYKTYSGGRGFMPMAIFINDEGVITKVLFGPKTEAQMRENVQKAIGSTI